MTFVPQFTSEMLELLVSRCENLQVAGADKTGRAFVNGGSEGSMIQEYTDVSKNRGGPPKWMVYNWKTLLKWMIWGAHPYFWKHPYSFSHNHGSGK